MSDRQAQIRAAKQVMLGYRLALDLSVRPVPPVWISLLHCIDECQIDLDELLSFAGPARPSKN